MTAEVSKSKAIPVLACPNSGSNNNNNKDSDNTQTNNDNDNDTTSPPEYVMIELNGELIAPVEFPSQEVSRSILGSKNGDGSDQVELGKLQLDSNGKTPVMILGSHQLKGAIETLKEPFCLMEKKYCNSDDSSEKQSSSKGELQSYQIVGIVKQKYLFNSYPKVIMR